MMNRQTVISTLIKLLVASFLVGLFLSLFDIDPKSLLTSLGNVARDIIDILAGFFEWALSYILIGAVAVIPLWLLHRLWRMTRRNP